MRRRVAAGGAALFAVLAAGCTPDGVSVDRANRFLEAYSTYRISDALALVTNDVVVRERDGRTLRGRGALRSRMGWDSVVATQFRATEYRSSASLAWT